MATVFGRGATLEITALSELKGSDPKSSDHFAGDCDLHGTGELLINVSNSPFSFVKIGMIQVQ